MDKKKILIVSIILIISLVFVTIGLTYAYLSVSQTQSSANTFSTSCFGIEYNANNNINLVSYPMSDTKGLKTTPYAFTITNTCATTTNYQLILNVKTTTDDVILPYINYSIDGTTVKSLSSATIATLPSGVTTTGVKTSYLIDTGSMSGANSTKSYNLYLWINESGTNELMNKKFEASVMVYAAAQNS